MLQRLSTQRLPWPLPALVVWAAAWGLFLLAHRGLRLPLAPSLLLAAALAVTFSLRAETRWRRLFTAWGFPLSLAASGLLGEVPSWAWLVPLVTLALFYPVRSWSDAPLFPTPAGALRGLAALVPMPPGARILDAGCGLGDGLIELRREYPDAQLAGLEWSWPLALSCAARLRDARVRRGDIWSADWSGYALVYVFQRPESMARAAQKAARELKDGAWLASLEFPVPGLAPTHTLVCADGRRVWVYRMSRDYPVS
ncbi:MAG: class I SAM-dependent methyltransferase [Rhizobacter sp.]